MNVKLIKYQGPMLKALGRAALTAIKGPNSSEAPSTPGPMLISEVPPRPDELIDAYIKWSNGDAARYRTTVPPHLFPQWAFPLLSQTLEDLPYKLTSVLNQGTRVEINGEIPRGKPLVLKGRLEAVEDDGYKARIHQRIWTGTEDEPELTVSDVFAVLVHKRKKDGGARAEDDVTWETVGDWRAGLWDGLEFGILTGDLNPVHWIPPYAKAAGFKRQILHGFGTFARSWEAIARNESKTISEIDVRFVKPLILPARVDVQLGAKAVKGVRPIRVIGDKNTVFMAGSVKLK